MFESWTLWYFLELQRAVARGTRNSESGPAGIILDLLVYMIPQPGPVGRRLFAFLGGRGSIEYIGRPLQRKSGPTLSVAKADRAKGRLARDEVTKTNRGGAGNKGRIRGDYTERRCRRQVLRVL